MFLRLFLAGEVEGGVGAGDFYAVDRFEEGGGEDLVGGAFGDDLAAVHEGGAGGVGERG